MTKRYTYTIGYSQNKDDTLCYLVRVHNINELEKLTIILTNLSFHIHGIVNSQTEIRFHTDMLKRSPNNA